MSGKAALLAASAFAALAPQAALAQAQAPDPVAVEEIVVTAQRREERLQDVPAAVSAVTGDRLEAAGISSTAELTQVTPSLNFVVAGTAPQPTIRGIGARGTSAGDESIVPIYVDGVYQPFAPGLIFEMADVARVEVLRGPQGTLYGRNATGGAINIVTKAPTADANGYVTLGYGSFEEKELKLFANGGSDVIAANIALSASKDDGYQKDVGPYGGRLARQQSFVIRPKVMIRPTENSEVMTTLSYSKSFSNVGLIYRPEDGNTAARRTVPDVYIPTPGSMESTFSFEPHYKVYQISGSVVGKLHFDGFDIVSITGAQRNQSQLNSDSDGTYVNTAFNRNRIRSDSYNQEIYLSSTGEGRFRWIAGVFYYHDTSGYDYQQTSLTAVQQSSADTDSYAVYGEGTFDLTETLSVTLGGRYTVEEKDFTIRQTSLTTGAVTRPPTNRHDWDKFTPSAGIQWRPNNRLNVYAKVGQAFKSGVYNTSSISRLEPVDQELVTSYEVGVKAEPLPWLRTNFAAFSTTYENMQATARDPVTNAAFLQNAAGAELYGAELDVTATPIPRLNIRFAAAAVHGEFTEFENAQLNAPAAPTTCALVDGQRVWPCGNVALIDDLSGYVLPKTPDLALSLGADYTMLLGENELTLAGNVYRSGRTYWYADNRLKEDPYVLVNGQVTYRFGDDGKYRVTLWGENLTDEQYRMTMLSTGTADLAVDNKPRSFGVRVGYAW